LGNGCAAKKKESAVLIEHRAYTLKPGCLDTFYAAQLERGFELVKPIMERCLGYFTAQSGPTDQVVHLYRFDNYDDWTKRLHGLYGVAGLEPYFKKVRALMSAQENKFLVPSPLAALTPLLGNGKDWLPGGPLWADRKTTPEMIIEEHTLILVPGSLPPYWAAYQEHGLKANGATQHLLGCFVSLVGRQHQVVHYRCYPSFGVCRAHRDALAKSADWQAFMRIVGAMTASADSKLLTPAPIAQMAPLFARP
jgi:NIPSNAP